MSVLLQYNRGALYKNTTYLSVDTSHLQCVSLADMNNDTLMDIVVANYSTNSIGFLPGYGNSSFGSPIIVYTKPNLNSMLVSITDFNGDDYVDMAVTNDLMKSVDLLLGTRNRTFTLQTNVVEEFRL